MKRLLFVSVLVAGLTVPSAAISSTQGYSSSAAKRGFSITFTVVNKNGKPNKVKDFGYSGVDATCKAGGPLVLSGSGFGTAQSGPNGPAKVEDKEFHKNYAAESNGGGEGTFKVTGEFKQHNTKIRGTIRVKGDFPEAEPDATGCDSGTLDYVAT